MGNAEKWNYENFIIQFGKELSKKKRSQIESLLKCVSDITLKMLGADDHPKQLGRKINFCRSLKSLTQREPNVQIKMCRWGWEKYAYIYIEWIVSNEHRIKLLIHLTQISLCSWP